MTFFDNPIDWFFFSSDGASCTEALAGPLLIIVLSLGFLTEVGRFSADEESLE